MLRSDYSRSLREARNLPEDVGRMINYYAYYTPEEEFLYLAIDLLNLMNAPGPHAISDKSINNIEVNSENIKRVVDYLKLTLKNSFQEFLDSFSDTQLDYGVPLNYTARLVDDIYQVVDIRGLNQPYKMSLLMDKFLLNRGRNEGIIKPNQSVKDFFRQFQNRRYL